MSWAAVGGATGYSVWRAEGPSCSNAVKITDIPVEGTAFEDHGLRCGGTYTYFATAEGVCCLPPSGECGTVTLATCLVPIEAAPLTWIDKDTLAWPAVAGAWSYKLYEERARASRPARRNSQLLHRLREAAALSWGAGDPSLLEQGDFYWYLVTAANTAGEGSAGDASAGFRTVNSSGVCP
jgi:hypothetical protein